jgi:hypothetical protein
MMVILVNHLDSDIPCTSGYIQYPAFEPFELLDCHFSPVKVPPQAEKMIEEVVGGGNVVEEASNRIRMEEVGLHFERDGISFFGKLYQMASETAIDILSQSE